MRHSVRLTVGILIATVACLVATVAAQKGKPAPTPTTRWTIQVVGDSTGTVPTIMGGNGASGGVAVIYDPTTNPNAQVFVGPSSSTNVWNRFSLILINPAPLADLTPTDSSSWITFRNIAMDQAGSVLNWGLYTANANKLGPVPLSNGWGWPFIALDENSQPIPVDPVGAPDYQASFLNSGSHPRQYYEQVYLLVTFRGDAFTNLSETDGPLTVYTNAFLGVYKRNCADPLAVGIGISGGETYPSTYPATVTRLSSDQWQIEIEHAFQMIELGWAPTTLTQGKKTVVGCESYSAGGWRTTPVKFTLVVTRVTS